ncbi:MAG: class I SAM-dependent rRNA methyltransferase [Syntrophales bacterium]|nr:class I SAM-dependent rRNA methyltransferase [Syntrophales bacterium]
MSPTYPIVILKAGREKTIIKGHPWVFSGAIREIIGEPKSGDVVCVTSAVGEELAYGFFNPHSDIAIRLLSWRTRIEIERTFWRSRIKDALELRKRVVPAGTTAFRLVNAEGDGMPGLIVDKYGDYLVISIETIGVERAREEVIRALIEELNPYGIYERSGGSARIREGLSERKGLLYGKDLPEKIEIREYGLRFLVDVMAGQKTGFFLDQRENRRKILHLSNGARVLNCFSYTGGFSIYALKGGANEVVSVDVSEKAIGMIDEHLQMNGLDTKQHRAVCADVFDYLRIDSGRYDVICLDPPPFARTRKDVERALRGYKDINRLALKRLAPNGLLVTFSCSGAVDEESFFRAVCQAAGEAGCSVRLLERLGASPDHPTLIYHPEGRYLKGFVLSLMESYEKT